MSEAFSAKSSLLFAAGTEPCFVSVGVCASAGAVRHRQEGKGEQHGSGLRCAAAEAPARAHQHDDENVEREQREHGEIEPGLERHRLAHHVAAHLGRALDGLERLEHGLGGDDVEGARRTGGTVVSGGMLGARLRRVDLVGRKRRGAGRRRRQLTIAVERLDRRQGAGRSGGLARGLRWLRGCLRLARGHIDLARPHVHGAAKHLHEQAGQRQVRPIGIRRHMEQHDPAVAPARRGDEGRAVGEPRPDLRIRGDGGIGEDLAVDLHVIGDGEAAERACRLEGRERLRRAPGERPAKLPSAAAKRDGKQLIATLLEARTGEANQHAAGLEPALELLLGAGDELADIGENDGRDLVLDQLVHAHRDIGFGRRHHIGVRRKRALHIIEWREERLRGFSRFT